MQQSACGHLSTPPYASAAPAATPKGPFRGDTSFGAMMWKLAWENTQLDASYWCWPGNQATSKSGSSVDTQHTGPSHGRPKALSRLPKRTDQSSKASEQAQTSQHVKEQPSGEQQKSAPGQQAALDQQQQQVPHGSSSSLIAAGLMSDQALAPVKRHCHRHSWPTLTSPR